MIIKKFLVLSLIFTMQAFTHASNTHIANNLEILLDHQYLVHVSATMLESSKKIAGALRINLVEKTVSIVPENMLRSRITLHHSLGGVTPPKAYHDALAGFGQGFSNKEKLCAFIDPWSEFQGEIVGGTLYDVMTIESHVYRNKSIAIIPLSRQEEFTTKNQNFAGTVFYFDAEKEKIEDKVNHVTEQLRHQSKQLIEYPIAADDENLFLEKLKLVFQKKGYLYGKHSETVFGTIEPFFHPINYVLAGLTQEQDADEKALEIIHPTISALRDLVKPLLNNEKNLALMQWQNDTDSKITNYKRQYSGLAKTSAGFFDRLLFIDKDSIDGLAYFLSLQFDGGQFLSNIIDKFKANNMQLGYEFQAKNISLQIKNICESSEETIAELLSCAEQAGPYVWQKDMGRIQILSAILADTSDQNKKTLEFLNKPIGRRFRKMFAANLACLDIACVDVTFFDLLKFALDSEKIITLNKTSLITDLFLDTIKNARSINDLEHAQLIFPDLNLEHFRTVKMATAFVAKSYSNGGEDLSFHGEHVLSKLVAHNRAKNEDDALKLLIPKIVKIPKAQWFTIIDTSKNKTMKMLSKEVNDLIHENKKITEHEEQAKHINYLCYEWLLKVDLTSPQSVKLFQENSQTFRTYFALKRISVDCMLTYKEFLELTIQEFKKIVNPSLFDKSRLRIFNSLLQQVATLGF